MTPYDKIQLALLIRLVIRQIRAMLDLLPTVFHQLHTADPPPSTFHHL